MNGESIRSRAGLPGEAYPAVDAVPLSISSIPSRYHVAIKKGDDFHTETSQSVEKPPDTTIIHRIKRAEHNCDRFVRIVQVHVMHV